MKAKTIFTGVLAHLDSTPDLGGDIFPPDCKIEIAENITIHHEFDRTEIMGKGKVIQEGNQLKYEIALSHEKMTPELIETLTPVLGGALISMEGKVVKEMRIEQIGLTMNPSDPRLKPLKETK